MTRKYRIIISFFFATVFTLVNLFSLRFPFIEDSESSVQQKATSIKTFLNHSHDGLFYENDFLSKNFLLINTTRSQAIGVLDSSGLGKFTTSVTDRGALFKLLKLLAERPEYFNKVILDLDFSASFEIAEEKSGPVNYDDSLVSVVRQLQFQDKIIIAGSTSLIGPDDLGILKGSVHRDNIGSVSKQIYGDYLLNYALIDEDKTPSLPLLMLNKINAIQTDQMKYDLIGLKGGGYLYNYFMPEMLFDYDDIANLPGYSQGENSQEFGFETGYVELVTSTLHDGVILESVLDTKNPRSIFVGAFTHDHEDMHLTRYGRLDGSLILLNIYHGLVSGMGQFHWYHILLLFCSFLILFWFVFAPIKKKEAKNIRQYVLYKIVKSYKYIYLLIITVLYYFIFNLILSPISLLVYLALIAEIYKAVASFYEIRISARTSAT